MHVTQVLSPAEQALKLVQRHHPEYHPLVALAKLAHDPRVAEDAKLELEVHKAILPYVQPKLSNIEVKAEVSNHRRVVISLFDEEEVTDVEPTRRIPVETNYVVDPTEIVPLEAGDAVEERVLKKDNFE